MKSVLFHTPEVIIRLRDSVRYGYDFSRRIDYEASLMNARRMSGSRVAPPPGSALFSQATAAMLVRCRRWLTHSGRTDRTGRSPRSWSARGAGWRPGASPSSTRSAVEAHGRVVDPSLTGRTGLVCAPLDRPSLQPPPEQDEGRPRNRKRYQGQDRPTSGPAASILTPLIGGASPFPTCRPPVALQ